MLKNFLVILTSLITGHCIAQPEEIKDSVIKTTDIQYASKKDTHTGDLSSNTTLKIYPNPAKNKITLNVAGFEPGLALVKITDAKGKILRADNRLLTNGTEDIAMFLLLQPGIYFISVSEKNKVVKKKLIVL